MLLHNKKIIKYFVCSGSINIQQRHCQLFDEDNQTVKSTVCIPFNSVVFLFSLPSFTSTVLNMLLNHKCSVVSLLSVLKQAQCCIWRSIHVIYDGFQHNILFSGTTIWVTHALTKSFCTVLYQVMVLKSISLCCIFTCSMLVHFHT